ncbi:MAG: hypothetical protein IT260_00215 [Saprospiraceae bacterium]|nr:hypothetical protein [Saprospiraceae bacterium]
MLWIVFALAVVLWTALLVNSYFKKKNAELKATLVIESASTFLGIFLGAFVGIYFSNLNQKINDTANNFKIWKNAAFEIQLVEENLLDAKTQFALTHQQNSGETFQHFFQQNYSIELPYLDHLFDDIGVMKNTHERTFSAVKVTRSNIRKMEKILAQETLSDQKVDELLQLLGGELKDLHRMLSWEAKFENDQLSDALMHDFHEKLIKERAQRAQNNKYTQTKGQ